MSEQCKCSVNTDNKKRRKKSLLNRILWSFITTFMVLSLIVIAYSFWILIILMIIGAIIGIFSISLFYKIIGKK